jgi:hypothetical protein
VLALCDGVVAAIALALAISHGTRRDALVHFGVYLAIVLFFKVRDASRRVPALIAQARASNTLLQGVGPWWLRTARLLVGYDTWSRTERLGLVVISAVLCTLFGWDDGGPFAAALFGAVAIVNASLALIALAARATQRTRP